MEHREIGALRSRTYCPLPFGPGPNEPTEGGHMPRKYHIEASFELETQIEPDYVRFEEGDSEDFENDSSFSMQDVSCDGGRITFTVEADSEEDAESQASEIIFD